MTRPNPAEPETARDASPCHKLATVRRCGGNVARWAVSPETVSKSKNVRPRRTRERNETGRFQKQRKSAEGGLERVEA
jgi:hypothetical protein